MEIESTRSKAQTLSSPLDQSREKRKHGPTGSTESDGSRDESRPSGSEENQKSIHCVEIAGLTLRLKSAHDEGFVRALASRVDQQMKGFLRSGSQVSFQNALVLTALHLAEELMLTQSECAQRLKAYENEIRAVITHLDRSPINQLAVGSA